METKEVPAVEDTQAGTTPEYVDLHEASDDDISAFLENADKFDSQAESEDEQAEPAQQTQTEAVEPPKEEPKGEPKVEQAVSKQDFEALKKQLDGQELLIKRRTSELGELRNQFQQFIEQTQKTLDEKFYESPTQALADARKIEMAQQKIKELDAEEQTLTNSHQAQVLLAHHVGPDGFDVEAISESLASDNLPREFIEAFKQNPFQSTLPETLIQLAKRAQAEKKVRQMEEALNQLVPYTQKLLEERKSLPQHVLKNVHSALRQSPQVTASAGGTGQVGGSRSVDPALMSDAELEEFLKG